MPVSMKWVTAAILITGRRTVLNLQWTVRALTASGPPSDQGDLCMQYCAVE